MATVMIVDDEEFVHRIFQKVLSALGHKVVGQAYDGNEAVRMYCSIEQKPDVVLMDHRMPIKDGISATTEILQEYPTAQIVFVSADESIIEQALKSGALRFLAKPIRKKELFEAIGSLNSKETSHNP